MIDRNNFLNELKLRSYIRKIISEIKKDKKKILKEEQKLRKYIRQLIIEVKSDIPEKTTARSTGINILEELLKKILPLLEESYKSLTTDVEQRKSFRAHIIRATQNMLTPGRQKEPGEMEKLLSIDEGDIDASEEEEDINVKIGSEKTDEKPEELNKDDEDKFIDIDKQDVDPEEIAKDYFTIPGLDETGRNLAMEIFEKIKLQISNSYNLLDNPEDEEIFFDYAITNIKLYMDVWEDELLASYDFSVVDGKEV